MPLQTQELSFASQEESDSKGHRPILIKWKDETIIRSHSLRVTVREILNVSKALDVVKVGIIGEPATGKTTLAESLGHLIHKISKEIGYLHWVFRVFGEDEFLNLEKTILNLDPANYVLYFHDLSFLTERRKIEEVKRCVTNIRHMREDVHIILIYDYHYTMGLDKYLRQANFRYFTSIGSSEMDNMLKIVGTKYSSRVKQFSEMFVEMTTKFKSTFKIGASKFHSYTYKDPFVSCLFYNNSRLRYIIFPKRQWIDRTCSDCTMGANPNTPSVISVKQFKKEFEMKYSRDVHKTAVKLKLYVNGMNFYSKNVVSASRYLDKALETKLISLEELALAYEFTEETKTKMRKKMDGVFRKFCDLFIK